MTGGFFYSSPGNILELFQQITFTQRVSLTEKKPNKPDSTVCIFFFFFLPLNSVIILHRAERKPSVAGESISTRQLSQPLWMQERPHHQRRPHRSDWWEKKQVQSGVQQTHKHAHTGGVKLTHTPAWVVSSPWQPVIDPLSYVARESENINDGEEAAAEDGKRWYSGWENSVYAHREAHTDVLREGSKKFVFGHVCKATLSRCRLSCSILNCCSLLIVRWTVPIVWTFAVTHVLTQKSKTIHGLKCFICIKKNLSSRFALKGTIRRFCNRERFAECEESPVSLKDLYQVWNY